MSREGETRDAAYFEARRDDPDEWGDAVEAEPTPRRTGLAATITVRFTEEEAAAIRRLAKEADLTYSEIVRRAVQAFTRPRFTLQQGAVRQEFLDPIDLHQAAEKVITERWNRDAPATETATSSKLAPAHPRSG
jgi:hypothetical protein